MEVRLPHFTQSGKTLIPAGCTKTNMYMQYLEEPLINLSKVITSKTRKYAKIELKKCSNNSQEDKKNNKKKQMEKIKEKWFIK